MIDDGGGGADGLARLAEGTPYDDDDDDGPSTIQCDPLRPIITPCRPKFVQGVGAAFHQWTALHLAVDQQWGEIRRGP